MLSGGVRRIFAKSELDQYNYKVLTDDLRDLLQSKNTLIEVLKNHINKMVTNMNCLDDSYSYPCLLYTSPSPRDGLLSRMPSSA